MSSTLLESATVCSPPRISVTLVTRNRPESLAATLASLREQSAQPWEVVVSDDSSPEHADATRAVAERFGARYVAGPRRGLYANRNHAARAAQGTHVRTMDDDHLFPPGHWAACEEAVRQDPDAVWTLGEVRAREDLSAPAPCPPQLHPRGFGVAPADPDRCWALADGSTLFPRRVWDEGEGYAELFPFGALFYELGSRLHWRGYRIRHLAATHIIHDDRRSPRSIDVEELDQATRYFAMLCHTRLYQPTLGNQGLCAAQLVLDLARRPALTTRALRSAWPAYQDQRRRLSGTP